MYIMESKLRKIIRFESNIIEKYFIDCLNFIATCELESYVLKEIQQLKKYSVVVSRFVERNKESEKGLERINKENEEKKEYLQ